ncbi:cation:proton antiporter [Clostridium sp.]|uniref:cation:proton antiporter n=1 Tax=Clostridium sp. TaxID=1506 RepID=UPI002609A8FA|nr:cation:proton antiporter [Clostridium sp.]
MLTSLALIFILGLSLGTIAEKLKLPKLIGMIIAGIILSPYFLNLLDGNIMSISSDLRRLALVIILTRAGLSLDIKELKKVGRPAVLMCFLPATLEMIGVILIGPRLLGISYLEAAIIGSTLAAVSPAVIVPRMIKIMEEGYGNKKSIPQLVLAGASIDDIFVIVMFTAFTSLAVGDKVSIGSFLEIPTSIITGILLGVIVGGILVKCFKKVNLRDTVKVVILLSISFLLLEFENSVSGFIKVSGLLAIMSMGLTIYSKNKRLSEELSKKYDKLWIPAEIILFVLIGAIVDLNYIKDSGVKAILLILFALVFRIIGVFICLIKTDLNIKERIFCSIAYLPKATVQAAIGGLPLAMGLSCGNIVLTVALLSILITAPIGAFLVDIYYKKLLEK